MGKWFWVKCMRKIGLLPLIMWYEQRKLDNARIARFNTFFESRGYRKVKGKWCKKEELHVNKRRQPNEP